MKRVLIFLLLSLLFSLPGLAQKIQPFEVHYLYSFNKVPDSLDKKYVVGEGDTVSLNELELFRFTADFWLQVSDSGCLLKAKVNHQGFKGNSDPIFFDGTKWYRLDENRTLIPEVKFIYEETGEHKTILQYDCMKFIVTQQDSGAKCEIWATPSLPAMLNPQGGAAKFRYGILEVKDIDGAWDMKATRISFMQ